MKNNRLSVVKEFLKNRLALHRAAAEKAGLQPEKKVWILVNRFSLLLQAAWSIILYFAIEVISRHSVSAAWDFLLQKPQVFLYNAGILFTTFLIVYLFRRRELCGIL